MKAEQEILHAIRSVPLKGWEAFFETIRQQQYKQITSALPEKLLELQAALKATHFMEHLFAELREEKEKTS